MAKVAKRVKAKPAVVHPKPKPESHGRLIPKEKIAGMFEILLMVVEGKISEAEGIKRFDKHMNE